MRDLRYALRTLRKSPGFVAVATVSLGLALGLGTTTYAVLDAVVNPDVPIREPERVVRILHVGDGVTRTITPFDRYAWLRSVSRFHDGLASRTTWFSADILAGGNGTRGNVHVITPNYFEVLGIPPSQGRWFRGYDDTLDDQSALVSHRTWQRFYAGHTLDNASITINKTSYTIVGVMPPNVDGDAFVRLPASTDLNGAQFYFPYPLARLRAGITLEEASTELAAVAANLTAEFGTGERAFEFTLIPMTPPRREFKALHFALGGAALGVLLIACANLANLMLARGFARRRELALQTALGASRATLIRQSMAEAFLIGLAGAALGSVLAYWGISLVVNQMPPEMELIGRLAPTFNWRVFTFGLGATAGTLVLFGLLPALRISTIDVSEPLKSGSGTTTARIGPRYNRLAIVEIAATMVLLMGTGLMIKAASVVDAYDFGYNPSGLFRARAWLDPNVDVPVQNTYRDGLDRVSGLPGVLSVSLRERISPLNGLVISEFATGHGDAQLNIRQYQRVSEGFLSTLGIPIVMGRDFQIGDDQDGGRAIVDEDAARLLFSNENPIGRQIKLGGFESDAKWVPVVGVARNAALSFVGDPDLEPLPKVYVNEPGGIRREFVVRTQFTDAAYALQLQNGIESSFPNRYRTLVMAWHASFQQAVATRKFLGKLFGVFGGFALFLAAVGLFGVLNYSVTQRMREFGIRVAVGARRKDLLRLVFHDGAVIVLAGTGIGAFFAMAVASTLKLWLYTVPPTDAGSLLGAEAALVAVALIACLVPAIHATRSDPVDVLRSN